MPRTTNKGVRFTDDELTRIEKLRAQLSEYSSEADLLHHAALLGILVLATYATRPDLPPYAGYGADDLAALLKPRLMPAIDFLIARGALPMVFTMQLTSGSGAATTAIPEPERDGEPTIDAAVAEDLESPGSAEIRVKLGNKRHRVGLWASSRLVYSCGYTLLLLPWWQGPQNRTFH